MLVDELRSALPADRVIVDPDLVAGYARDEAAWAPYGTPLAVVRPRTAEEAQVVVAACVRHRTPLVPRGGGSGVAGAANAIDGGIVLSFELMTAIREIDPAERLAVVEPGVINDQLRAAAAAQGLWYPPDPASASWSTVGGNVATNAGGLCCVKYGVTADYVLALQVVTGTGELVRLGRRTAKGVAGYDLARLMVGSEGTLGVITEITVRLRPAQLPERTVAGHFASLVDAGRAVAAVGAAGLTPSALELVDQRCLEAVDAWQNTRLASEANAVLLARSDLAGAAGEQEAAAILACFEAAGATWAARSTDQEEADALFEARRLAYPALERRGPVMIGDVCVPIAAMPEMLGRVEKAAAAHAIPIANLAHAGDGNLHPLLITPPDDDDARERAHAAYDQIITDALELGGTVTGEHGIGLHKIAGFRREVAPAVLDLHRAVKAALDPHGILNPGKVFT